jgi:hypothetical protein
MITREQLEASHAVLRSQAIAVGKELERARLDGLKLRVIRGLEHAHSSAWLRVYAVDSQIAELG